MVSRVGSDSAMSARISDSDEEPLPSDFDRGNTFRRSKVQSKSDEKNREDIGERRDRMFGHQHTRDIEGKDDMHTEHPPTNSHVSEISSIATSEDMELRCLETEGDTSDDEETGLTNNDWRHWKKRRKREVDLDSRMGGSSHAFKDSQKVADRSVIKALLLNSLLVALWYLFSLSISIVSNKVVT